MAAAGVGLRWRGSAESLKLKRGREVPVRWASEEPDLITGIKKSRSSSSGRGDGERSRGGRNGLRKRFLSLTEGIAQFLSPEKKTRDSLSRKGSKESLCQASVTGDDHFQRETTDLDIPVGSIDLVEPLLRQHASSFSSFRPYAEDPSEENNPKKNLSHQKGRSPFMNRLKKAPPSPPPRRFSFWSTPSSKGESIAPMASNLPPYLRPPPPPPPVRFCNLSSPSLTSFSPSGPFIFPSGPFMRERSQPSERVFKEQNKGASNLSPLMSLSSSSIRSVIEKTVSIVLAKENGTFGFTVRGGMATDGICRPLLVTHVRPGGPADREGTLKAGDRLIAVDGKELTRCSLSQAQVVLQEVEHSATLAIRFDISVMDSVRCGGVPLLVEIERTPGYSLGVILNSARSTFSSYSSSAQKNVPIVIENIRTASIAERCGALSVGDVVNAVDGLHLDLSTLKEANQILEGGPGNKVTLEVVPNKNAIRGRGENSILASPASAHRCSIYNTLAQSRSLGVPANRGQRRAAGDPFLHSACSGGVSHTETVRATLLVEGKSVGLGLRNPLEGSLLLVAAVDPGGAADKSGVICVGDRILGVNGRSVKGLGVPEVMQMMTNTQPTVILDTQIDVADSIVPSSGTFSIKLSKRHCCLGIRVARGRRQNTGQPVEEVVLISDIVRGSSAHRSGILQVGDRVLAIDNTRVDSLTLEETKNMLNVEGDVITLKILKDDLYSDDSNYVTYSVQLIRDKGVLGISATGTEDPFEPIIVGGIVPGSLAAQTGAIHVGDRLLSINGVSMRGKPLSEAIRLLQGNEDTVTLKISRPKTAVESNGVTQDWISFHGPPTLSVDSAVESWGSGGGIDVPQNAPTPLTSQTNSTPELFRSNCGSTVRRRITNKASLNEQDSEDRKSWGSSPSSDSGQSDGTDWDKMIADLNQISATCGLREKALTHDANGNIMTPGNCTGDLASKNTGFSSCPENVPADQDPAAENLYNSRRHAPSSETIDEGTYSVSYATALHRAASPSSPELPSSVGSQIFTFTLTKDPFYEDFGFSVSDGLYEKGVYVNRVRKGGPAHRGGLLKPYDRILQVNETQTEDFDCCLTVPLIASAEDTLFLKVSRQKGGPPSFRLISDLRMNPWLEAEEEDSVNAAPSFKSVI